MRKDLIKISYTDEELTCYIRKKDIEIYKTYTYNKIVDDKYVKIPVYEVVTYKGYTYQISKEQFEQLLSEETNG